MQLTKLDRWLKEKFIYETHIFTLRIPEDGLPAGVVVKPMEENKGGDYRHRIVIRDNELAVEVQGLLKADHIMHATHIMESKNWYNRHISPKNGGSFTFKWIFRFFAFVMGCGFMFGIYQLTQNEELVKSVQDSIKDLKGEL